MQLFVQYYIGNDMIYELFNKREITRMETILQSLKSLKQNNNEDIILR